MAAEHLGTDRLYAEVREEIEDMSQACRKIPTGLFACRAYNRPMPPSPEFAELEKKRAELEALEQRLAEREVELSTLESKLAAFHAQCVKRLGPLFARL